MNGRDLTLSLVGALAVGSLLGRRGSPAVARPPAAFRDLAAWTTWARTEGVDLRLAKTPSYTVEITDLFADTTGTGAGTRVMQALAKAADKAGMPLTLHPSSPRNVEFYGRFGFSLFGSYGMMRRDPKARGSRATTTTPAFQRWFGESKVVDGEGRPLVVYHANTFVPDESAGITEFDKSRQAFGKGGYGFYFSDQDGANLFAEYGQRFQAQRSADGQPNRPNITPVYLDIKNPLIVDHVDDLKPYMDPGQKFGVTRGFRGNLSPEAKTRLQRRGYDGIITRETTAKKVHKTQGLKILDRADPNAKSFPVYVVFEPTQIKSAVGNRGTFDPADPRISYNRSDR